MKSQYLELDQTMKKMTTLKSNNNLNHYKFPNIKIGVIIPAFNECNSINKALQSVPQNISNKLDVIVVDDGSKDNTAKIAKNEGAIVIKHGKNRGYGAAVRTGFDFCFKNNYEVIVNLDSDGQHDPRDIVKFITPILNKEADFVLGNRYYNKYNAINPYKLIFSKLMSVIYSILFHKKIYDPTNGYRAFSRNLLQNENFISNYTITQEILFKIVPKYKIIQVYTHVLPREHGNSYIRFDLYLKKTTVAFYKFYILKNFPRVKKFKHRKYFEQLGEHMLNL